MVRSPKEPHPEVGRAIHVKPYEMAPPARTALSLLRLPKAIGRGVAVETEVALQPRETLVHRHLVDKALPALRVCQRHGNTETVSVPLMLTFTPNHSSVGSNGGAKPMTTRLSEKLPRTPTLSQLHRARAPTVRQPRGYSRTAHRGTGATGCADGDAVGLAVPTTVGDVAAPATLPPR
jgi:hypothetical protein